MTVIKALMLVTTLAAAMFVSSCASKSEPVAPMQDTSPSTYGYSK